MNNHKLQTIGFFILLGLALLLAGLMFWPYFKLIALAAILAVLFAPINNWLKAKIGSKTFASLLTLLLALFIVFVPVWLLGQVLFNELANLYQAFRGSEAVFDKASLLHRLPQSLQPLAEKLNVGLSQKLFSLSGNLLQAVTGFLLNVPGFLLACFLVFLSLYYFLRDGDGIKKYISQIFPLSKEYENIIMEKLEQAIAGVVKGSFLVALAQGTMATIGFFIFGAPQPVLWGAFTVLAALVPTVGTSLSLIPAVIYLLVTGHTGAAIGLGIWSIVAVGTIDNIISPKLIGTRTNLHPLLVLFSVLGGMELFGFIGFLLGPIIMAVFMTLLDIYRVDLKEYFGK